MSRVTNLIFGILFLAVFNVFVYSLEKMRREAAKIPPDNLKIIVIPGAHVNGRELSLTLQRRIDAALDYGKKKDITYVVTGGKGKGEDITEALAMKKYLVSKGVHETQILTEENSTTTYENFRFTLEKYPELRKEKIGIATSDYHIARAVKMAVEAGFWRAYGIPAPTRKVMQPNFFVRECFAFIKWFVMKHVYR